MCKALLNTATKYVLRNKLKVDTSFLHCYNKGSYFYLGAMVKRGGKFNNEGTEETERTKRKATP